MALALQRFVLRDAAAAIPEAGGKGRALAEAARHFPVPHFFVILSDAFTDAGLKSDARADVSEALLALGGGPFAVRSSGLEEDGASAAHAGQFETELNVARSDVVAAAERVWRSGFSATLAQYREAKGLSGVPQPPSVVVQVMVRARAAGVAFSADPVSGDRSVVVVSAVAGLADRLVAGEVDGDTYRLAVDGRTLESGLAGYRPVLSEDDRVSVALLARAAEEHFGAPQDIEWAFDGAAIRLLQSRPITTLPPTRASGEALTIWDNSNIVESYPGVTAPLTFSFARYVYSHVYRAFSALMGVSPRAISANGVVFDNMLGRIDGRVYYNLLNWYRALALFPGFQANRKFMEEMMGVGEALPDQLSRAIAPPAHGFWPKFVDQLRFARVGAGLVWHGFTLPRTIERFYVRLNAALAPSNAAIDALSATALAAEYHRLEQRLLARWDAPLINDFLCMIAFGASRKALEKWASADGLALHSDVMIGQGDIVSAEPARMVRAMGAMASSHPDALARLARGERDAVHDVPGLQRAFDAYLAKFADRCTQELKLESPTLDDDPNQLLMAIAASGLAPLRLTQEHTGSAQRLRTILGGKLIERMLAGWLLNWAKARVRDRENLRFERTRLFGRVRRIFRGIGRHFVAAGLIDAERDVFFLTVDETLGAVEGGGVAQDLRALIAVRKAEDAAQRERSDPAERLEVRGAHLIGLASRRDTTAATSEGGETRAGLACCAGRITARVRVIDDPRIEALTAGEILVARHTDPGWIAVFANAAGVIAERGSLLSHSAIVAREMGVPCVVALKGATTWLRTGDLVTLDGGAGTVERVEAAP